MHEAVAPQIESWASFYVIVGSSAGALTGLQFVVMTLIADFPSRRRLQNAVSVARLVAIGEAAARSDVEARLPACTLLGAALSHQD